MDSAIRKSLWWINFILLFLGLGFSTLAFGTFILGNEESQILLWLLMIGVYLLKDWAWFLISLATFSLAFEFTSSRTNLYYLPACHC